MNKQQAISKIINSLKIHLPTNEFWTDEAYITEIKALSVLGNKRAKKAIQNFREVGIRYNKVSGVEYFK